MLPPICMPLCAWIVLLAEIICHRMLNAPVLPKNSSRGSNQILAISCEDSLVCGLLGKSTLVSGAWLARGDPRRVNVSVIVDRGRISFLYLAIFAMRQEEEPFVHLEYAFFARRQSRIFCASQRLPSIGRAKPGGPNRFFCECILRICLETV